MGTGYIQSLFDDLCFIRCIIFIKFDNHSLTVLTTIKIIYNQKPLLRALFSLWLVPLLIPPCSYQYTGKSWTTHTNSLISSWVTWKLTFKTRMESHSDETKQKDVEEVGALSLSLSLVNSTKIWKGNVNVENRMVKSDYALTVTVINGTDNNPSMHIQRQAHTNAGN